MRNRISTVMEYQQELEKNLSLIEAQYEIRRKEAALRERIDDASRCLHQIDTELNSVLAEKTKQASDDKNGVELLKCVEAKRYLFTWIFSYVEDDWVLGRQYIDKDFYGQVKREFDMVTEIVSRKWIADKLDAYREYISDKLTFSFPITISDELKCGCRKHLHMISTFETLYLSYVREHSKWLVK